MGGIISSYLPTILWVFGGAVTILSLLIMFGFYIFWRYRQTAHIEGTEDVASLAAKKQTLQADVEALRQWMQEQKTELDLLTTEREEQKQLLAELAGLERKCASKDQENQTLRNEVGALENQKHLLAQTLEKIERDIEKFDIEVQKLESRKHDAEIIIGKLDRDLPEKKNEFERLSSEVESQRHTINDFKNNIRQLKTDIEDLEFKHNSLLEKVKQLPDMEQQFDLIKQKLIKTKQELEDTRNELVIQQRFEDEAARKAHGYTRDVEELGREKIDIENKLEDLEKALTKQEEQHAKAEHEFEQTEKQLSDAKHNLKDTKGEVAIQERLKEEAALKVQKSNLEIDRLKSEETALKSSIKSLEILSKRLNKQLDGQEGDANAHEDKYRDLWHPVSFPDLSPVAGSPNEKQLLKYTADYIKGQKLYFPERVLYAFHTALKVNDISPLVVLAGISGTGKSELPRRYAEGMGLHFVILPVQPRWDSPQDLFGFYNYLEGRYKATELARAMVQFELYNRDLWPLPKDWNHDCSDRMLLVLLDEMNLARVEYYFSEFLSRLEFRRGINLEDVKKRAGAEISLEMGSLREGEKPIRLFPGQNILFSGTMNEDETTQALSDKVLDRACVMRFGRPKKIMEQVNVPEANPSENGLTFDQWRSWLKERNSLSEKDQVNRWINDLNDAMDNVGRPFAHRVIKAIQSYVANYPDWVSNRIGVAMADQIEQRIMPKLRGIEIEDANQPLTKIRSIIEQCDDQRLLNAFKKGSENQQIFLWRGIDRMEYYD
jgi:predicted  nucleic acid-binding Zn-ribbon protein